MQRPSETWTLERLAEYVLAGLAEVTRLETQAMQLSRRSAVQTHQVGHALSIVRGRTKPTRQWSKWLKKHDIPRTTAWEAIKLFESVSEAEVSTMTITEAKARYGIYPEFMPDDETATQPAVAKEMSTQAPEQQLCVVHRHLRSVATVVNSIEWKPETIFSVEVDEILEFCEQVATAIIERRKKLRRPRKGDTKEYLAHLQSL
jgi:hypothetical protein